MTNLRSLSFFDRGQAIRKCFTKFKKLPTYSFLSYTGSSELLLENYKLIPYLKLLTFFDRNRQTIKNLLALIMGFVGQILNCFLKIKSIFFSIFFKFNKRKPNQLKEKNI